MQEVLSTVKTVIQIFMKPLLKNTLRPWSLKLPCGCLFLSCNWLVCLNCKINTCFLLTLTIWWLIVFVCDVPDKIFLLFSGLRQSELNWSGLYVAHDRKLDSSFYNTQGPDYYWATTWDWDQFAIDQAQRKSFFQHIGHKQEWRWYLNRRSSF